VRRGRRAGAFLAWLLLALPSTAVAATPRRTPTPPPAPAPPAFEPAADALYRLGRDALARGAFEMASRLFAALEGDPRWDGDARYAFNRAQAARYQGDAGEAVYWYSRYLALDPAAADARTVEEQLGKLIKVSPSPVRATAERRLKADYRKLVEDAEIARALDECPRVRLLVRFTKVGATPDENAFSFPGRAVYWHLPEGEPPEAYGELWVVPVVPISAPDGIGAPPLLMLAPGRPLVLELGPDLVTKPAILVPPRVAPFPADPDVQAWRISVVAEVDPKGPPVLLASARAGTQMADVRSGPNEGAPLVGKKKRELPGTATPLSFGPRVPRPDSKAYPRVPLLVLDLPGKDGAVERWAAPIGAFDVVNRFGKLVESKTGVRLFVRADGTGPFLTGDGR